jgi:hypothetical protein
MRREWFKITNRVATLRDMPPANEPQPSQQQRAAILNELEKLISTRKD